MHCYSKSNWWSQGKIKKKEDKRLPCEAWLDGVVRCSVPDSVPYSVECAWQCAWQCGVCPGVPDSVPHLSVALCPICDGKLIWRKNGRLETRKITFVAFVNLVMCQQISWYFHDKMCDLCRIGLLICICFPVAKILRTFLLFHCLTNLTKMA